MKQILFAFLIAAAAPATALGQVGDGEGRDLPFLLDEPPPPGEGPFPLDDPSLPLEDPPLPLGEPPPLQRGEPAPKGDRRAAETERSTPATEAERRRARLDAMFDRLAKAETERRANRIARNIMQRMTQSGSDTVDLLMYRAGAAMQAKNYALALDYLDGVVRLKPDFAEGWNRRATAHFLKGDYGRSLLDIEETLKLEPRHFGALAGLAMILVAVEKKEEAVEVMTRALQIHPFLPQMKERRDQLEQELEGARI